MYRKTESMDWPTTHTAMLWPYALTITEDDEFSVYRWIVQELVGVQAQTIGSGTAYSLTSAKLEAVELLGLHKMSRVDHDR